MEQLKYELNTRDLPYVGYRSQLAGRTCRLEDFCAILRMNDDTSGGDVVMYMLWLFSVCRAVSGALG